MPSCSARRISTNSRWALRPSTRPTIPPAIHGICLGFPGDPRAVQRRRWRPGWRSARSGAIREDPSASLPPSAAWSGSNPPTDACRATGSSPSGRRSTRSARSPATSVIPPSCSGPSRAPTRGTRHRCPPGCRTTRPSLTAGSAGCAWVCPTSTSPRASILRSIASCGRRSTSSAGWERPPRGCPCPPPRMRWPRTIWLRPPRHRRTWRAMTA